MKVPKKIYIHVRANKELGTTWHGKKITNSDIEYTCTDVAIEKAVRFLKNWDAYRVCLEGHKDWFIEQFKKYMEE